MRPSILALLLSSAVGVGLISAEAAQFWQIVTAIGLTVTPLLALLGRFAGRRAGSSPAVELDADGDPPVIVVGFGRVGRLVADMLTAHGKPAMSLAEAARDPDVLASLDRAVARTNQAVSRAESIRKYRILPTDLTIANGYLTPKLSVRRQEVLKDFAAEIEALYSSH